MAITETRSLPPQFVEDLGKDYATQLTGLTSQKLDTTQFQPMVAGQDQATQDAYSRATTQGQGIGSYAPYLQAAGQYQTGTGTFAGQPTNMMGAQDLVGPQAYQQFMSPYQQDVIDATLSEYDKQAQAGITNIGLGAAKSGNLGGGREGVMRANYMSNQDANRALLQSKLLQQGFNQANLNAQTAFNQQGTLGGNIQDFQTADINQLGRLGTVNQLQEQAKLDAEREANRLEAYEPYERLGTYGSGVASLFSGNAPFGNQSTVTPNPTPLQTALGTASVLSGIFGGKNTSDKAYDMIG